MQVDLLTVDLVNFEMGLFLVWSFSMLVLPLLFGFPFGVYPVPPVDSLPFEGLMVRVPHHDPEHGRRVMAVSLPFESLRALSLSKRSNRSYRQVERQSAPCVSPDPN